MANEIDIIYQHTINSGNGQQYRLNFVPASRFVLPSIVTVQFPKDVILKGINVEQGYEDDLFIGFLDAGGMSFTVDLNRLTGTFTASDASTGNWSDVYTFIAQGFEDFEIADGFFLPNRWYVEINTGTVGSPVWEMYFDSYQESTDEVEYELETKQAKTLYEVKTIGSFWTVQRYTKNSSLKGTGSTKSIVFDTLFERLDGIFYKFFAVDTGTYDNFTTINAMLATAINDNSNKFLTRQHLYNTFDYENWNKNKTYYKQLQIDDRTGDRGAAIADNDTDIYHLSEIYIDTPSTLIGGLFNSNSESGFNKYNTLWETLSKLYTGKLCKCVYIAETGELKVFKLYETTGTRSPNVTLLSSNSKASKPKQNDKIIQTATSNINDVMDGGADEINRTGRGTLNEGTYDNEINLHNHSQVIYYLEIISNIGYNGLLERLPVGNMYYLFTGTVGGASYTNVPIRLHEYCSYDLGDSVIVSSEDNTIPFPSPTPKPTKSDFNARVINRLQEAGDGYTVTKALIEMFNKRGTATVNFEVDSSYADIRDLGETYTISWSDFVESHEQINSGLSDDAILVRISQELNSGISDCTFYVRN